VAGDGSEGGQAVQAGVAGEGERATSPLVAAVDSPLPLACLAGLLVAITFALLMSTVRLRSPKQ
jgi:hypothetical protein